ncbi:MAG: apolipoprotein N-acyltransferase [Leptolyngbyaceae cyanobacterium]
MNRLSRIKAVVKDGRALGDNGNGVWLGAIALLSGMAMGFTNAPTDWWLLAWIAQAPLWLLLYHHAFSSSPTHPLTHSSFSPCPKVLLTAFLWATGYYGTTLVWITGLHPLTWMGIPWLVSVAIALSCWVIVTLWGGLWSMIWAIGFVTILRWIRFQPGFWPMVTRVMVGTALWCELDTLWSQSILYWPTLALTQSPDNLWVLQLNQLSGPITTTALIAATNGLLAEFCFPSLASPPSLPHSPTPLISTLTLIAIAHLFGAWLYVHPSPAQLTTGDDLSIGLIQGNIPTRIKLTRAGIQQAFDRYTEGYHQLVDQGADLVVLPEGAIPLVWDSDRTVSNLLTQMVGDRQTPALIGTFATVNPSSAPIEITQSVLMVVPTMSPTSAGAEEGSALESEPVQVMSRYNKVKLVPLGEYIPADGLLGALISRLSPIQSTMVPGDQAQVLQTPWGVAIAGICYESAFPELFRQQTLRGGEWMMTAANNDPYNGAMMAQHHAQDVMRAIESDRWMVRVTNTGYSGVVSPRGETVWRSQRNTHVTHVASIQRRRTRTPYVRWGNWLPPLLLGVAGMMVVAQRLMKSFSPP